MSEQSVGERCYPIWRRLMGHWVRHHDRAWLAREIANVSDPACREWLMGAEPDLWAAVDAHIKQREQQRGLF